jgi:hypothetical protein
MGFLCHDYYQPMAGNIITTLDELTAHRNYILIIGHIKVFL